MAKRSFKGGTIPLLGEDGKIETGFIREYRPIPLVLKNIKEERKGKKTIPKLALEYAEREAEITGQPLSEVLESRPVKEYISKLEEKVRVE